MKIHTSSVEPGLGARQRAIDSRLDALVHELLHLQSRRIIFAQVSQKCFPLAEFGIAQDCILDQLIALVFAAGCSCLPFGSGFANEFSQSGVDYGRLRGGIDD